MTRNELHRSAPALLHSIPETAALLSCSERHVYNLISSGQLRTVNLGTGRSKSRIRDDDLRAFIETRTAQASA